MADAIRAENFVDLADDIRKGNVAAFIGAGVSRAAAGLPDWRSVAILMASRLGLARGKETPEDLVRDLGPYGVMELAMCNRPPLEVDSTIQDILRPQKEAISTVHEALLSMPIHFIVTTNWDTLIESTVADYDKPVTVVRNSFQLRGCQSAAPPVVVKVHGSFGEPIVARERDVHSFEDANPGLTSFLQSLFFTHRLLFVGYSFADPDFQRLYYWYDRLMAPSRRNRWAQHDVIAVGEKPARVDLWRSMGLNVYSFPAQEEERTAMLVQVLKKLSSAATPSVSEEDRPSFIADRLQRPEVYKSTLRIRTGFGPLGAPRRLRDWGELRDTLISAMGKAEQTKIILSADAESITSRSEEPDLSAGRLRRLIEFFEDADSELLRKVVVVDRRSPYEIQQYIIGSAYLIESRKIHALKGGYPFTRLSHDPETIGRAIEIFDVCFDSFVIANLEDMLHDPPGAGREELASDIRRLAGQHDAPSDETLVGTWNRLVETCDAERQGNSRLEEVMLNESPGALFQILPSPMIHSAIRTHLLHLWRHDLARIASRAPHSYVNICNRSGDEIFGHVDKRAFHDERLNMRPKPGQQGLERSLWNMHVAGLAFSCDGERLVLRRRLISGNRYDRGKWDRTVVGHVRMHSSWDQEMHLEIRHHFNRPPTYANEWRKVSLERFKSEIEERRDLGDCDLGMAANQPILVARLTGEQPVAGSYSRTVKDIRKKVVEHALTMPYVCLLSAPELPDVENNNHALQWAEVPLDSARRFVNDKNEACPIENARVLPSGEATEISRQDCTEELVNLLGVLLQLF